MKKLLIILGLMLVIFAVYVTFFSPSTLPISPLGSVLPSLEHKNTGKMDYVIFGFAPYWNLKKLTPESLNNITHFAYFHLLLNGDGSIYTKVNKKSEDPGYTNYKRLNAGTISYDSKPLIITFMPESQTALASSIGSSLSRQRTISTIKNVLAESGAMGVNIDYEPVVDISQGVRDNFTLFIKELRSSLASTNSKQLTISIYASTGSRPRLWDLTALSNLVDYFVVMSYDYTMPGSSTAGPNAPLRGSGNLFEHDIIKNIAELTKSVPSTKLLLGIPFYGYEWDTVDSSKYAPVESKGSTASFERIQKMLDDKTLELVWDRNTLTPYGIATGSGQTSQIYFENETSLRLKMDFVKSASLGGIAIWALGYEGNNSWVWPIINQLNQ
ncbi:MAG: glycoside hydrolase family 18 protein [bacterium]